VLGEHELLSVTESRYAVGQSGPGPHVHREHSDCFYVLDGDLTFELAGGEPVSVAADAFVAVPPGVVHTFRNEGPREARFLNLHAPDCGFVDYMRAMRDGEEEAAAERFDTFDPPADGGRPARDALLRGAGQDDPVRMGPSEALIKAGGEDGAGHVAVLRTELAGAFPGPVRHRHHETVDSFYVLEGSLAVTIGESREELRPGGYAMVPPGAVHTFSNPSDRRVRVLNVMAPGGFEPYLKEVAAALRPGAPPNPQEMARIASRYDFEPAG
jgi:mannose-6-phosphate isomerase-like protein (cupin superfamily)